MPAVTAGPAQQIRSIWRISAQERTWPVIATTPVRANVDLLAFELRVAQQCGPDVGFQSARDRGRVKRGLSASRLITALTPFT